MSRTDKDMPYWVRAEWFEPYHRHGWISWYRWNPGQPDHRKREWRFLGECDLPAEPVIGVDTLGRRAKTRCHWSAEWTDSQSRYRKSKREWRRAEFYGPQRMMERRASRRIISGDLDTEYPDGRTRHSVLWNLE